MTQRYTAGPRTRTGSNGSGSKRQAHLEEAAAAFQRAVRLDPANDDAAYDLELLLAHSKAQGTPVGEARPEKRKTGAGHPGIQQTGSGY